MVSDHGAVLFFPGVIHGDAAAAEIHAFAHVRITHISQVGYFRALPDPGVFHLDKIAQVCMRPNFCIGTQVDERTDIGALLDFRLFAEHVVELHIVAGQGVDKLCVRADDAVFADYGLSAQDGTR